MKSALTIVTPNYFFGSIDLKQAYFIILVSVESQGWLVFWWHGQYFAFTVLANRLSYAPRVYTKIIKPFFSSLWKSGHNNVSYIDDSLLKGDTEEDCADNIFDTVKLVDSCPPPPQGFGGPGEKGYLFQRAGEHWYFFRGAREQAHNFGYIGSLAKPQKNKEKPPLFF